MLGRQNPFSPPSHPTAALPTLPPRLRIMRTRLDLDGASQRWTLSFDAGAHLPHCRRHRHRCAITDVVPLDGSISLHRHPASLRSYPPPPVSPRIATATASEHRRWPCSRCAPPLPISPLATCPPPPPISPCSAPTATSVGCLYLCSLHSHGAACRRSLCLGHHPPPVMNESLKSGWERNWGGDRCCVLKLRALWLVWLVNICFSFF